MIDIQCHSKLNTNTIAWPAHPNGPHHSSKQTPPLTNRIPIQRCLPSWLSTSARSNCLLFFVPNLSDSLHFMPNQRDVAPPIACFYVSKVLYRLICPMMTKEKHGSDEVVLCICGQRVEIHLASPPISTTHLTELIQRLSRMPGQCQSDRLSWSGGGCEKDSAHTKQRM